MLKAFGEGRLFGSTSGSGVPAVLALHGWGRSSKDFTALMAAPTDRSDGAPLDALALDLPGFGASPEPPEPWGAAEYAEAVSVVLAEMAAPVVVVGHSFGGKVAVHLAAGHPERVRGLVLTGVPLLPRSGARPRAARGYAAVRRLRRFHLVSEARLETARQRHGSADYLAARGVMRDVLVRSVNESHVAQLEQLSQPVALLWGSDDTEVPVSVAQAASAYLTTVTLTECPGVGHLLPTSVPSALRRAVDDMVTRTRGSGP